MRITEGTPTASNRFRKRAASIAVLIAGLALVATATPPRDGRDGDSTAWSVPTAGRPAPALSPAVASQPEASHPAAAEAPSVVSRPVSAVPVRGVAPQMRVKYAHPTHESPGLAGFRQEECLCDLDCADGDPCTEDLCGLDNICTHGTAGAVDRPCDDGDPDGLFCTTGLCDTLGNCLANQGGAADVCGAGYVDCGTPPCCDDVTDICDECDVNLDCDDAQYCNGPEQCISDECEFGDDPCPNQACDEDNDMCTGEVFDGRCCEDGGATCNVTSWSACQGAGQLWAIAENCPCPKYSSGWGPPGDFWNVGYITEQPCEAYAILGDDYVLANGSYMILEHFRFVGGVECTGNGTVVLDFWDSATEPPTMVDYVTVPFDCPDELGVHFWTVNLPAPFIIPPMGYVTLRPGTGSSETAMWWLTDVVDIGGNDPNLLWYNENRTSLWSNEGLADILTFELEGTKTAPPLGACCSYDGLECVETVEWLCIDNGGPPMEWNFVPGGTCPDACEVGACCILGGGDEGDCVENVESQMECEALPGGGSFQGYGTDCDPNCCLQPFTGGDDCDLAYVHEIVVPPVTTPPTYVTVTISGDTSAATQGLCFGEDYYGWFEAFKLVESPGGPDAECAEVWIDKCCTNPGGDPWSPSCFVVFQGCSEAAGDCGDYVYADDYAYQQYCGGDDGNFYLHFDAIPGGTYHYDMLHPPDAPVGGGPYQMHITVGACPPSACCTVGGQCTVAGEPCPDDGIGCLPCLDHADCIGEACQRVCTETGGEPTCTLSLTCPGYPFERCVAGKCRPTCNETADCASGTCDDYGSCSVLSQTVCEEVNGMFMPDDPICFQTCDLGACCTGPGVCVDNGGAGMELTECEALGGDWIPGARCADDPCAVCPFEDPTHCQLPTGEEKVCIDPAAGCPRVADDFRADASGPIERLCWWPCYYNVELSLECHETPPADDWWVRFYEDDAGLPGAEIPPIGGQELVVDAAAPISHPGDCWAKTAPVTDPPIVQAGYCYWIELSGVGEGPSGCRVFWLTSGNGNSYLLRDGDGVWGPEDIVLAVSGDPNIDMSFCVDVGMVFNDGCGEVPGVCCTITGCIDATHGVCRETGECSGGIGELCNPLDLVTTCPGSETCVPSVFYPYEVCPGPCAPPPVNDNCENAIDVTGPGQPCEGGPPCTFPTSNVLASQDVPGNTPGCVVYGSEPSCNEGGTLTTMNFGADIWYEYHTALDECGELTASMCAAPGYDGCIAIYEGCDCYPDDPPLACGDDTCGLGGDVACVKVPVVDERCYLIRVGGWAGEFGTSQVEITLEAEPCPEVKRPMPEVCGDICGPSTCSVDGDCVNTSSCIPQPTGEPGPGTCYAPKNRYISIARHPEQVPETGRRISVQGGGVGPWWVGPPTYNVLEDMYAASVQDTPAFAGMGPGAWVDDDWPDVLHVKGDSEFDQIIPAAVYEVQAIQYGDDIGDEGNYSEALVLPTVTVAGDLIGQCPANVCTPANGFLNCDDVYAVIARYQGVQNGPLTWFDIDPWYFGTPDGGVGLGDILTVINLYAAGCERPEPEVFNEYGGDCGQDSDCWDVTETVAYCVPPPCENWGDPGTCYAPKNRWISLRPQNVGAQSALRVKPSSCPEGVFWWVGNPHLGTGVARLQEEPEYRDWSMYASVIHVGDYQIVPNETYYVQAILEGEDTGDEVKYSEALELRTVPIWGDVVSTCFFDECLPPYSNASYQPDIDDLLAIANHYVGVDNGPWTWFDVMGQTPNGIVDVFDCDAVWAAFYGQSYPGFAPCEPCSVPEDCDDTVYCNGLEDCDTVCRPGMDPCPDELCDEVGDICIPSDTTMSWNEASVRRLPSQTVTLESLLAEVDDLVSYQVTVAITRTSGSGVLTVDCSACPDPQLCGVRIDQDRYVFAGLSAVTAIDCPDLRAGASAASGSANVGATPEYLVEYDFDVSSDAALGSTFAIEILPEPYSFLVDSDGRFIPFNSGASCVLIVAEEDCNGNGVPDEEDISGGTSTDCNLNTIPDECEIDENSQAPGGPFFCTINCDPDCNENGIPDACDIYYAISNDCNSNGIPDECEIDENSPAPGGPFFCTEDCDPDCNVNGIPDECDIDDCPGDPECDDCNLNGVPDWCDIEAETSPDDNGDGIPDECVTFTGGGSTGNWSDPGNWELEGEYPNNTDVVFSVTLGDTAGRDGPVLLDVPVEINTLRILDGAVLEVNDDPGDNLTIVTEGGLLIRGNALTEALSELQIGSGQVITLPGGLLNIEERGRYLGAIGTADGMMIADRIALTTICDDPPYPEPGTIELTGSMGLTVSGNLTLDGSPVVACHSDPFQSAGRGGITPPPKYHTNSTSPSVVLGDFEMEGAGEVEIDVPPAGREEERDAMILHGDFVNSSIFPEFFNWASGSLVLNGAGPQTFEVAGEDWGPTVAGFGVPGQRNFSMSKIELVEFTDVTFLNNYDNRNTGLDIQGNCDEALYVNTLVLGADTHVTVDNCIVYYGEIINYGAEIEFVGCGDMTEIVLPADPENAERPNPWMYTEYGGICNDDSDCWGPAPTVAYCVLAAEADPSGLNMCYAPANRYISIARREDQVAHTARRITLQGGGAGPWWVGEPSYNATEDMYFASVVDEPVYSGVGGGDWVDSDWPDVVHVKGCEIAPGATYLVQAIQMGQDIGEESNYSEALELRTAPLWGDIVSSCAFDHCLPPEGEFGQPSIDDVLGVVNAFVGIRNAPLTWMDVDPVYADGEPEGLWTLIGDVLAVVNAFSGDPYPGWGPTGCP